MDERLKHKIEQLQDKINEENIEDINDEISIKQDELNLLLLERSKKLNVILKNEKEINFLELMLLKINELEEEVE